MRQAIQGRRGGFPAARGAAPGAALVVAMVVPALFAAREAAATDYYLDADGGDNGRDGTSPEAAWRTLARLASVTLVPGDVVRLRRGGVWREELTLADSGAEGAPIVLEAYGEGAPPTVTGADPVTGWTPAGAGRFAAPLGYDPEMVFLGDGRGTRVDAVDEIDAAGEWTWSAGTLTVGADVAPTDVEATRRTGILEIWRAGHVTVRDLAFVRAVNAVSLADASDVTLEALVLRDNAGWGAVGISAETAGRGLRNVVRGCTITGTGASRASAEENNPGCGVFVWGLGHVDGTVIDGNTIEDNGGHGIAVIDGKNGTISGNDVARNGWSGIGLAWSEASGTVIERNRVRENCRHVDDCFGINLFRTGNDNVVRYNTVHAQHDTLHDPGVPINEGYPRKYGTGGIRFDGGDPTLGVGSDYLDASGNRAYYNVVFAEYVGIDVFNFGNVDLADNVVADATSQGIVVMASNLERRPVTGTRVVNNVVFRSAEQHFVHVDAESSTLDHNLYFPDGASLFRFARESVDVTTDFAGFRARTGGEAHSLVADPLFLGAETNDYHLEEESPAVDAGMDVGLATDMDGSAVPWGEAVDIGAFEWRTGGGEDGGAGGADGGEDGGADGADAGGDGDADGDAAGADGDAAGTDGDADGDTAGADGGDGGGPSGPGESCGCGGAGAARGGMPGALAAAVLAVVPILASRRVRRRARGARPGRAYSSTTAQTCTSGCSTSTSPCNSAT